MQEKETNAGKGDKRGKRRQMREKETNAGKGDKRGKRRQTREKETNAGRSYLRILCVLVSTRSEQLLHVSNSTDHSGGLVLYLGYGCYSFRRKT